MKAVFEFEGEKFRLDVPLALYHINKLTDHLATRRLYGEDEATEKEDIDWEESYDFLEEELREIFADSIPNVDVAELYCEFLIPQTDEEAEFGCLIKVYRD